MFSSNKFLDAPGEGAHPGKVLPDTGYKLKIGLLNCLISFLPLAHVIHMNN